MIQTGTEMTFQHFNVSCVEIYYWNGVDVQNWIIIIVMIIIIIIIIIIITMQKKQKTNRLM